MGILKLKSKVPEGRSGAWAVERFEVAEGDSGFKLHNLRASFQPGARPMHPGSYTKLVRGGVVVMSDTRAELIDHMEFASRARGHVLVNGLGLGLCLQAALDKPVVEHVTVVERSRSVIRLVWPSFMDEPRATIIHACAYRWEPPRGTRWDVAWHDVWDHITSDNLPGMHRLHRKYGRRVDWQGSWCSRECEHMKREGGPY